MLRALRLHSWDVFAYELLSNQLRALRLLLGQFSSGQRQPIMLRALRLHSWDVFAYEPLPNPLRPVSLPLGRLSSGQRQPITLRLQLVFLGRFRIRVVAQSAAPCGLASWTTQQDYTRCRLGSQGTKLHIVVYPQEKHPLSTGGKGCFRKIFKAFERGEKFFQKSYAQAAAIPSPARLCARGTGCRCPPRGSGASKP